MYLFVYGTLKNGKRNHHYIQSCSYLGRYSSDNGYGLVIDGLPFMVKRKGGPGVVGELYEVNTETMMHVDQLEGHPFFYKRVPITVYDIESGAPLTAQAYIHPDVFDEDTELYREYTGSRHTP